jgi:hypothetical protein
MSQPRKKRGNVKFPLAVLIVDDSQSDAQLNNRLLIKAGNKVGFERVETTDQIDTALRKRAWDIVISDYSLSQFNGSAAPQLLIEKHVRYGDDRVVHYEDILDADQFSPIQNNK